MSGRLNLLLRLHQMEQRLSLIVRPSHADALLSWFVKNGQHLLELELCHAHHDVEACATTSCWKRASSICRRPDELRPETGSLKERVLTGCGSWMKLGGIREGRAGAVRQGARSVRGFLRATIDVAQLKAGTLPGRVWVLVFDGMRFDSWRRWSSRCWLSTSRLRMNRTFACFQFYRLRRTGYWPEHCRPSGRIQRRLLHSERQLFAVNMG